MVPKPQAHSAVVNAAIKSRDPADIDKLSHAQIQVAAPDQKLDLIRIILDKNGATHRLSLLWSGISDATVKENIDLWRSTWQQHADVMGDNDRMKLFTLDVASVANGMLGESEAACEEYLEHYGLSADAPKSGQSTKEREQSLAAVQSGAVEVLGAQTQVQALRAVQIEVKRLRAGPDGKEWETTLTAFEPTAAPGVRPRKASSAGTKPASRTSSSLAQSTAISRRFPSSTRW